MRRTFLLKTMLLLCALVVGSSAWAADQTIEITCSNFTNTSYNTAESTFLQSGFTFGYINAMRNGSNGTPSGWAKDQVIQTKSGGYIYNKTAISGLKNIRVYTVVNTNSFTITSGTSAQPTTHSVTRPSTATGTENITYSSYSNKTVTPGQATTASYYDFEVSNNYFQIAPGGSLYIWKIVLTYDEGDAKIDPTLSFPQASYDVNLGDDFTAPTLSRNMDGTGAVTYSSSNTNVATVNSTTGAVTVKSVGSTTITANVAADDKYKAGTAQYVLNVNFQVTDGVFDFEKAGGQNPLEDYDSGVTMTSSNTEYVTAESSWIAVNVTMVVSGKYRWWENDKTLRFYDTSYMEFSVPDGYVITKIDHTGGTLSNPSFGSMSSSSWIGASQSVKLQASGNFKSVTVTYAPSVSISTKEGYNFTTYVPSQKLDFSAAEGIHAYVIPGLNSGGTAVEVEEVDVVDADTPILVMTDEAGATVDVPVTTEAATSFETNCLVKGTGAAVAAVEGKTRYVLSNGKFKKIGSTSATVPTNKAYLEITTTAAPELSIGFSDGDATGIGEVRSQMEEVREGIFDLSGRRVENPTKGLYIVNGKKVVIK